MARPRLPVGAHGSIKLVQIEKGKWRARTLYRFPDGKRRQVERHGPTKGKAENALLAALTQIEVPTGKKGVTVAVLAQSFLQLKKDAKLAPGSIALYEQNIRGPIAARLGSMVISEVTPMHIQGFMTAVVQENGPGTAKTCKAVLSGVFKLAIRSNLITVSPVAGLEAVKSSGDRAAKGLPAKDMRRLLAAVRADAHLVERDIPDLWEFMAHTGCRIGEALALRWSHIDAEVGMVTLGPIVTRAKGRGSFIHEPGKTDEWRTIVAPAAAMTLLERRRATVAEGVLDLVFPDPFGRVRSTSSVEMLWAAARDRVGFPSFSSHGFRKTVATVLDDAGLSARDIAEYLGHKNPSMTQDVYMAKNTQSKKAAAALTSMFGVSSGS